MQLFVAEQARQVAEPVQLGQGRDVGVQVGELGAEPDKPVMVALPAVPAVARGVGGDHRHPFCEGEAEALRVSQFVPGAGK